MKLDRRTLMALSAASGFAAMSRETAQAVVPGNPLVASLAEQNPPAQLFPLWPKGALADVPPGLTDNLRQISTTTAFLDRNRGGITMPDLSLFRPSEPNGAAILLIPGGGYQRVGVDREGFDIARALTRQGYVCAVLAYRLPHEGWNERWQVPLADAQRAMRLLTNWSMPFGIDPQQVHVLGFSAGGHLAGTLAIEHATRIGAAIDALDLASARPATVGLLYPVISMDAAVTHMPSRNNLLGQDAAPALIERYSLERHVTATCPPCFVLAASDDKVVPVANSYRFASALAAASVPHSVHVFDQGGHGFGLRLAQGRAVAGWLNLYADWLARQRPEARR